jgi:peptide/nickel transport system substrate-binding protein
MQQTTARRPLLKAVAAGSLVGIAGCTGSADDATFRFSVPFFPPSLDPLQNDGGWRNREIGVLESLFQINREGGVEPQLVADWSRSEDDLTWEFDLREEIVFHNGSQLNAEAVVFSLDRAFSETASRMSGLPVEEVEAVDDRTVAITTTEAMASLPAQLTRPAAGIIHPDSQADDGSIETQISTGPYKLESYDPSGEIVLTRHEDYYGTTPEIERAVFEQVSDGQTRLLKLQNDELQLAKNLPNSAAAEIEADDSVDLKLTEDTSEQIIVFNTDRDPLNDVRVRRAILSSIDRQAIVDSVLEGIGSPAYAPWDPETVQWANEDLEPDSYDPDLAASLLAEAGWELDDDGIRYQDGDPLELVLWTYTERPNLPDIAEVMQSQLGETGFDISVRVTEWGALDDAKSQGEYDMFIGHWGMFNFPDPDILTNYYDPDQNIIDSPYDNQRVIDLLNEGRATFDDDERKEIYDEIQEIVMEDVPVGFLMRQSYVNGTRANVEGYNPHPRIPELELEEISRS